MKRALLVVAIILAVLATVGWTQTQPKTLEYKFVYQCDEKKANALSGENWELVSMSTASYGSMGVATCAFKRAR